MHVFLHLQVCSFRYRESVCFALQIALTYGLYVCVLHYKLLLEYNVHVYVFCKVAVGYGAAAIKYFFT